MRTCQRDELTPNGDLKQRFYTRVDGLVSDQDAAVRRAHLLQRWQRCRLCQRTQRCRSHRCGWPRHRSSSSSYIHSCRLSAAELAAARRARRER